MTDPNGHLTKAAFEQFEKRIDDRLDVLEEKMDKLNDRVLYVYGFAGGIAMIFGLIGSMIF